MLTFLFYALLIVGHVCCMLNNGIYVAKGGNVTQGGNVAKGCNVAKAVMLQKAVSSQKAVTSHVYMILCRICTRWL